MMYIKTAAVAAGALMAVGMSAPAMADSGAAGGAKQSPGFLSGNVIQIPVDVPINVCGNTLNLGGLGNGTFGNKCLNR